MKKREMFLDVLRIISIFLVLYVHTGQEAMYAWIGKSGIEFYFGMLLTQLATCGTSIFFLISGYLLLDREESIGELLKHRVLRYIILLVTFGIIQQLYEAVVYDTVKEMSVHNIANRIYSGDVIGQYWFLYAYLGMLLILPFLRLIAKQITSEQAKFLIALFAIFEILAAFFEKIFNLNSIGLSIPLLDATVILPLTGSFVKTALRNEVEKKHVRIVLYCTGAFSLALQIFYASHTYRNWEASYGISGLYIVVSVAIFVLVRQMLLNREVPEKIGKMMALMGRAVLLIYLAEVQLKAATHFIYVFTQPHITWFFATILWLTATVLLGMGISFILSLIPGIRKLF